MTTEPAGLHGQTLISSNLDRTSAFLVDLLGLQLLKITVHHHEPRLAVRHFGFRSKPNGAVLTYVEWHPIFYAIPAQGLVSGDVVRAALDSPRVGDFRGAWGAGTFHHVALHVPDRTGLLKWKQRLGEAGVHVTGPYFRNYFHAIYFRDPDGAIIEIATTEPGFGHDEAELGSGHRHPPAEAMVGARLEEKIAAEAATDAGAAITEDMALRGLHHITSVASDIERTTRFYVDEVGLTLIKRTDYLDAEDATHYYYSSAPDPAPGDVLTFFGFPGFQKGRLGVGLGHHFSLRARDDDALTSWRDSMLANGVKVGPVEDHHYFRAAYFCDPDGHICALATPPDFTSDEPAGELGHRLCLPAALADDRREIERQLALRPAPVGRAPVPVTSGR